MTEFTKTVLRNVLFVVVLFCVGAGIFLLSGEPVATAVAVVAVGALMKVDDHRIRKARRLAC